MFRNKILKPPRCEMKTTNLLAAAAKRGTQKEFGNGLLLEAGKQGV
jgi:hypothetical protein